jgi:membrane protease subunit HflC
MKRNPLTIAIGLVLLLIFVLLLFCFQVRKSEVALVTTFGQATREAGPGAHLKWPWPIQQVHKFDQRMHNLESKFEQVQTSDGFNLLVNVYVGWNISDPKLFFTRFGDSPSKAEDSVVDLLRNTYSGILGKHPFSDFISTDVKELKFGEIEKEWLTRLQADVQTNNYGLDVKLLGIIRLGLPESVTEAVFDQMRKERQLQVTKIQSEGERQASDIKSAADAEAARTLADAEAQATRIRAQGESEAAKTFETFKQDPELANFILRLGALESFLKEKTTLVLDTQTEPLTLLRGALTREGGRGTNAPSTPRASKP